MFQVLLLCCLINSPGCFKFGLFQVLVCTYHILSCFSIKLLFAHIITVPDSQLFLNQAAAAQYVALGGVEWQLVGEVEGPVVCLGQRSELGQTSAGGVLAFGLAVVLFFLVWLFVCELLSGAHHRERRERRR